MSSIFGKNLKIAVFGQSHSRAIGCVIDTLPAGIKIDISRLNAFMARRAPGNKSYSTSRKEADLPEFLSGVLPAKDDSNALVTCGAPLCAVIFNSDARSADYSDIFDIPRPGHADFTANVAYGSFQDVRGGGHFSGRLTAPVCIAGGICKQYLEDRGIFIGAHISRIGDLIDCPFDVDGVEIDRARLEAAAKGPFPTLDEDCGKKMISLIESCRANKDSVGGCIECAVIGLEAGVGAPMCDGLENRLSASLFAIPAVKGVEFGKGFEVCGLYGSQNNDPYCIKDGKITAKTNNAGGILGGISNGMPIIFKCAFKPTPTIMQPQQSVSLSQKKETTLLPKGRHDPCILPRAVPVVEAVTAITLTDMLLEFPKHIPHETM